ncbi:MAG: hypothetical protein ABI067_17675 [Leifsonia sp.]
MTDTPLATTDQLGAYLQQTFDPADPSALLVLKVASAIIRDFLQQEITAVAGDVVVLDPIDGAYGFLPELPVTAVTLFETYDRTTSTWSTADPTTYAVSTRLGVVTALSGSGVSWPADPGTWRVTYNHGFATVPDGLMSVCVSLAARIYVTEDGIDMERIGGYQVKYQSDADGFSPLQLKILGRYISPRIA